LLARQHNGSACLTSWPLLKERPFPYILYAAAAA